MDELKRMAYLDALGIDSYVSRTQLPGAAITRRLAIASARAPAAPSVRVTSAPPVRPAEESPSRLEFRVRNQHAAAPPSQTGALLQHRTAAPRFSLVAMVAGEWLWLEELADMPLTTEQVQLVHAMAQALVLHRDPGSDAINPSRPVVARPVVAQFDWPIHTNHQLDLGEEAAQASVAGFVWRRLEQYGCRGLVLLGQPCTLRLSLQEVKTFTVSTASSADILARPALKRTVWQELLPLVSTL